MPNMANALSSNMVQAWHCDHFGHLNTRHYAAAFDDAIFVFWARFDDSGAQQVVPVTAEMKTTFKAEARRGTVFSIKANVRRVGEKPSRFNSTCGTRSGDLLATFEVEVFFDRSVRESRSIPDAVRAKLAD